MAGWIPEPESWSHVFDLSGVNEELAAAAEVEYFELQWHAWLRTAEGRFEVFYATKTRPA
jgi:hypothetical protein